MSSALLSRRLGELVARSAENAIFDRAFGASLLGSYIIAAQASRFACDVFTNPPIGALYTHAIRGERAEVRVLHARLVRMLSLLLIPAATLAAVTAPRLLPLLLGPKWGSAAPMFQPIVISYAVLAIAGLNDSVLMSNDMTRGATVPALIAALARVGAVALGPWLGPIGVAWLVGAVFLVHAVSLTASMPAPLTEGLAGAARALAAPAVGALASSGGGNGGRACDRGWHRNLVCGDGGWGGSLRRCRLVAVGCRAAQRRGRDGLGKDAGRTQRSRPSLASPPAHVQEVIARACRTSAFMVIAPGVTQLPRKTSRECCPVSSAPTGMRRKRSDGKQATWPRTIRRTRRTRQPSNRRVSRRADIARRSCRPGPRPRGAETRLG